MEDIKLKDGIELIKKYNKMLPKDRELIRRQRLYSMVVYARSHSKLYEQHYQSLGKNFFLRDVPMISTDYLLSNEDEWLCKDIIPNDIETAINTERSFSSEKDYLNFSLRGSRAVIIASGNESPYIAAWEKTTTVLSVFDPIEELVEHLNAIKPGFLWAYPSTLKRLAEMAQKELLNIRPSLIMTGGEPLTSGFRDRLSNIFDCRVQNSYFTREAGVIAYECKEGHLHVNDDWVILEALDENNRPCEMGVPSEKVLVSNLYKTDYPVIRAEVSEKVTIHGTDCPCGNVSPWITVDYAPSDSIEFENQNGDVLLIPARVFSRVFRQVKGIKTIQLLIMNNNNISVRLEEKEGHLKGLVFLNVEKALRTFLREHLILASAITMDADIPLQEEDTGKLKMLIDLRDQDELPI